MQFACTCMQFAYMQVDDHVFLFPYKMAVCTLHALCMQIANICMQLHALCMQLHADCKHAGRCVFLRTFFPLIGHLKR